MADERRKPSRKDQIANPRKQEHMQRGVMGFFFFFEMMELISNLFYAVTSARLVHCNRSSNIIVILNDCLVTLSL
jgi:hypothetical protein